MNDHSEMKQCPFCGGEGNVWSQFISGKWCAQPECKVCGATRRMSMADSKEQAELLAVENWNERVPDPNTRTLSEIHQIVDAVRAGIPMQIEYFDPEESEMDPDGVVAHATW